MKDDVITRLRKRVAETTTRRDGVITVVGLPPCSCGECRACEAREVLEAFDALRGQLEALYGVELFARAFAESEPLVSGYVRLFGRVVHLREIHALARAAVEAT